MPTIEIDATITPDIEIWCSCGEGLCSQSEANTQFHQDPHIVVEPCEKCLAREKEEGYEAGFKDGTDGNEYGTTEWVINLLQTNYTKQKLRIGPL